MCLIIVTDKPTKITAEEVASAVRKNPHGMGVMYYNKAGHVVTKKALDANADSAFRFVQKHARIAEKAKSEFAVHFRYATSGTVDLEHAHPYLVLPDVHLMHNGVIDGMGDKRHSDTWEYAALLSEMLEDVDKPAGLLRNASFQDLIGRDIGPENRLVFACPNPENRLFLTNSHTGVEYDGKWYSNLYAWDANRLSGGTLGYPGLSGIQSGRWDAEEWEEWMEEVDADLDLQTQVEESLECFDTDMTMAVEMLQAAADETGSSLLLSLMKRYDAGMLEFADILPYREVICNAYAYCARADM